MAVFPKGDNWTDFATAGPDGELGIFDIDHTISEEVGTDDLVDYYKFDLPSAANLVLSIDSTDAVKVTIYTLTSKLDKNGNPIYSKKALQSTSVKKNKAGEFVIDTKNLLLESNTYYIGVQAANSKVKNPITYSISLDQNKNKFYTLGNTNDDWTDFKTNGDVSIKENAITINNETTNISIDENWVGFGDTVDYQKFSLNSGAQLSFSISGNDAAKFVIYSLSYKLDKKGNKTYSKKAIQSSTLKKLAKDTYAIDTKNLLLDKGEYYFAIESTNAKKGGDCQYSISLDQKKNQFYTLGNTNDDWTDFKTNGDVSIKENAITINNETTNISIDENWVGFGDTVDYQKFSLDSGAQLSFSISGSDAAKFVIYSLSYKLDKKGNKTYSKKAIQSSTLKKLANNTYAIDTKNLLLDKGEYYFAIESTNAKKGGACKYSISLDQNRSLFYTKGDNTDDDYLKLSSESITIEKNDDFYTAWEENWVGLGDEIDYFKFNVKEDMEVGFSINSTDTIKFAVYTIVDGKLKQIQSPTSIKANTCTLSKAFSLKEGEYYFSIQSTNAKKGGNADYQVAAFKYLPSVNYTINSNTSDNPLPKLTNNNDKIILDKVYFYYDNFDESGNAINFKAGNDQLILKNESSLDVAQLYMGEGNDSITLEKNTVLCIVESIDFGSGNDMLELQKDTWLDGHSSIDFGSGNDILKLQKDAWGEGESINMNTGNDTITLAGGSELEVKDLILGDGDDSLNINEDSMVLISNLSFGSGIDKFVLNGKLSVAETIDLSNLENISGKGKLFLTEEAAKSTDLSVVQTSTVDLIVVKEALSAFEFTDKKSELADNTIDKALVLNSKNDYEAEFWLSGETAVDSEYAFVDDTDYLKFVMMDETDELYIALNKDSQNTSSSVNCDILDANDNIVISDQFTTTFSSMSLSSLEAGTTYYIKLSVDDDKNASGYLWLSETFE